MVAASMILRNIIFSLALALLYASGAPAMAQEKTTTVIELFTSQACATCPQADEALIHLSRQPGIIALTLPVDYWNYTGWRDTLALGEHTARQRRYADRSGKRSIFTPQFMVNGVHDVKGTSDKTLLDNMAYLPPHPSALSVPLSARLLDESIELTLPDTKLETDTVEIWICPVSYLREVRVEGGDNNGQTLRYGNVVRGWIKAADWDGKAGPLLFPLANLKHDGADMVVVLVQSGDVKAPAPILGATSLPLPEKMRRANLPEATISAR